MAAQRWSSVRGYAGYCTVWLVACGLLGDAGVTALQAAEQAARAASTNDWPQWRGPQGRATVTASQLPDPWPAAPPKRVWQARLGTGWSSPVVVDGQVYITDRIGGSERVLAFDAATGRELWNRAHHVDFDPHAVGRRHGNGPKATPLVHDGRVYAVGIAGWLDCLRASDGQVVWQVNYPAEFGAREPLSAGRATVNGTENVIVPIEKGQGAPVPLFGYTGSPALWRDFLITPVGGRRGGTIMAFHKDTRRVAWKALDENVSYSSPVVAEIGGVPQVVAMTGPRVVGLSAADGTLLWSHPFQIQYDESISTPIVGGDTVVVTATGRPATALRIRRAGEAWQKQVAWTNEILSSYLSSMVTNGEVLYGMNDGGEFSCVRLSDGKTLWTGGNHGYYASPILAGKRLLALNDRGMLAVLAADPGAYKDLGTCQLAASETWTMPAIVGSRIYVRSADGLACFETRP